MKRKVLGEAKLMVGPASLPSLKGGAVVVAEEVARKLATYEIIEFEAEISASIKEEFSRDLPRPPEALEGLTEDGLVRIGTKVKKGDLLIGKTSSALRRSSPEDKLLSAIFGVKRGPVDTSVVYPCEDPGIVIGAEDVSQEEKKAVVTVAVPQVLCPGDILEDSQKRRYVVAGILPREKLEGLDLVVSPESETANETRVFKKITFLTEDRWEVRDMGHYSYVTQIPLATGKSCGQEIRKVEIVRLAEMGFWNNVQEIIAKSNYAGTLESYQKIARDGELIAHQCKQIVPETVWQSFFLLRGIGFAPKLVTSEGEEIEIETVEETEAEVKVIGMKLRLACDQDVLSWSKGEVKVPEMVDYKALKPVPEGLFCQRIFGPIEDYKCACGKYRKPKDKGVVCERCGVVVESNALRRRRMGHIKLAQPVVNPFLIPVLAEKLRLSEELLKKIVLFKAQVLKEKMGGLSEGEIIEGAAAAEGIPFSMEKKSLCGAEAIGWLIEKAGVKIEGWQVQAIAVIPPEFRPLTLGEEGVFALDCNNLYRRVINRSARLGRLKELNAPEPVVRNETRMVQEAVWGLFDNAGSPKPVCSRDGRMLKSLKEEMDIAWGCLFDKRVDFSGLAVAIPDEGMAQHHIALPEKFLKTLFKPFLMHRLQKEGKAASLKQAKKLLDNEELGPGAREIVESETKEKAVIVVGENGLMTALEPVVGEKQGAGIHAKVAEQLGIKFQGEKVRIFLPLSKEAQAEAKELLWPGVDFFVKDGRKIAQPRIVEEEIPATTLSSFSIDDLVLWAREGNLRAFTMLDRLALGLR